jgi:hypothetical protein
MQQMQQTPERRDVGAIHTPREALNYLSREKPVTQQQWDALSSCKTTGIDEDMTRDAFRVLREEGITTYSDVEGFLSGTMTTDRTERRDDERTMSEQGP